MKFRSDADGYITAIRFYKGAANTGTHTGHLWDAATGTLLGTTIFAGETAEGWQESPLEPAVPITANTTYIVSYFSPNGQLRLRRRLLHRRWRRQPAPARPGQRR